MSASLSCQPPNPLNAAVTSGSILLLSCVARRDVKWLDASNVRPPCNFRGRRGCQMGALLRESDVRRDKCRLDKEDIHIPGKRNDRCTIGRGSLSEYILARRLILHDTIRALFRFLPVRRAPTLPASAARVSPTLGGPLSDGRRPPLTLRYIKGPAAQRCPNV